jgi:hypothetical protein
VKSESDYYPSQVAEAKGLFAQRDQEWLFLLAIPAVISAADAL